MDSRTFHIPLTLHGLPFLICGSSAPTEFPMSIHWVGGLILRDIQCSNHSNDSSFCSHLSCSQNHTISHPYLRREAPTYRICMSGCGSKDEREKHKEAQ